MSAKYTPIPDPTTDPISLRNTTLAIKQGFEQLTGQRKNFANTAVTWGDLVALGLIKQSQVPTS